MWIEMWIMEAPEQLFWQMKRLLVKLQVM